MTIIPTDSTSSVQPRSGAVNKVMLILGVRACDCGIQGPENLILTLSDRLHSRGVQYVVANLWDGEPPVVALDEELQRRGRPSHILQTRSGMSPAIIWKLASLIKRIKPDVIHTHDVKAEFAVLAARPFQRRPLIGSYYGRLQLVSTFLKAADIARFGTFRLFDRVLANSEAQRAELASFGVASRRVGLLPSFVDTARMLPATASEIAEARQQLGIAPSRVVLSTVARLAVNKGHTYMLRALKELVKQYPQVVYLIPGEGHMQWRGEGGLRGELEREAQSLGIQNHVRFLGYVADVRVVLNATDLLVSPSLLEGMQVAILEAMACALPIVATNIGGTPDAVVDGTTGLLVPPADPAALQSAIASLLAAPQRLKEMGALGRTRAVEYFDAEVVTGSFLQHCESVVQR